MSALRTRRAQGAALPRRSPWLVAALLAVVGAAGCEEPFEPYQETTEGPFSMFGYLDVEADTQWIRVMPVRQDVLADPAPVDAVVTLENLESGRMVTLEDSLFRFPDPDVGGVAYAHNFWTTERVERGATYRLRAVRSDGATTTATVEMPAAADVEVAWSQGPPPVIHGDTVRFRKPLRIYVHGGHLLYSDAVYMVRDRFGIPPKDSLVMPQTPIGTDPGAYEFAHPDSIFDRDFVDLRRVEMRVGVAPSDWPFVPGLSPTEVALPGAAPTNVENGIGFVGGVATWVVPLPRCNPKEARPAGPPVCGLDVGDGSAAIAGRVIGTCGGANPLPSIHLTERFPGGGTAIFEWSTSWRGTFELEGLEPGADLVLEIQGASPVNLPRLAPGERYFLPDVFLAPGCSAGATAAPVGGAAVVPGIGDHGDAEETDRYPDATERWSVPGTRG